MKIRIESLLPLIVALSMSYAASAHQQAERYIPLGQSPGVSGKLTVIGDIVSVDAASGELIFTTAQGRQSVRVMRDTRIWIDRSPLKQTNLVGGIADLRTGNRVEVMRDPDAQDNVARWIKTQPTPP